MKTSTKETAYIVKMLALVIFAIIPSLDATTSCNSFPKIFGGQNGNTIIYQMDVFNDYLAFGGHSFDDTLTGVISSNSIPYISLTSVSVSTKYYWSKVFS
jgi:hypothetical protein